MSYRICKFDIQDMLPIGLTLVVLGIGLAYGLEVMGDIEEDQCDGSYENYYTGTCYVCNASATTFNTSNQDCWNSSDGVFNATSGGSADFNASSNAITGVAKFPEKMTMIATVIIAAIIIGILTRYLMARYA